MRIGQTLPNRLARVSIRFIDPDTKKPIGSTQFARLVLTSASSGTLREEIAGAPDWRAWYLRLYSRLSVAEADSFDGLVEIASKGLSAFRRGLVTDSGTQLEEAIARGFHSKTEIVATVRIQGRGSASPISIEGNFGRLTELAKKWVGDNLAEPGLIQSFQEIESHPNLDLKKHLLIAVAGSAELAPTLNWLAFGGEIAVAARPNPQRWKELISEARESSGTLLVPVKLSKHSNPSSLSDERLAEVAGLDIVEDCEELAGWLAQLRNATSQKINLGLYAYAPGIDHIRVQGVQEALAEIACKEIGSDRLSLSWLATPTDSAAAPAEVGRASLELFAKRKPLQIIRDSLLGLFGFTRAATPKFWKNSEGEELTLVDTSVAQQGPSYLLAKRTQRWRAYLAHSQGFVVSYAIAPPARTDSVLRHKILRASYQGAPLFGVQPFSAEQARGAAVVKLISDLHFPSIEPGAKTTHHLHSHGAIHGGLWRLAYRPNSVWIIATILGFPALLRKGY